MNCWRKSWRANKPQRMAATIKYVIAAIWPSFHQCCECKFGRGRMRAYVCRPASSASFSSKGRIIAASNVPQTANRATKYFSLHQVARSIGAAVFPRQPSAVHTFTKRRETIIVPARNDAFRYNVSRVRFTPQRRGGRVAEGGGLLNRCTVKSCTGGSNPPLSARLIIHLNRKDLSPAA